MSEHLEFTLKRGATGAVMEVTLTDENGAFDLTGFASVTLTAKKGTDSPVINAVACTVVTPASGLISFAFTSSASIAAGEYDMEFKAIDGSGKIYIFPSDPDAPYGRLIVKEALHSVA